MLRLRIPFTTTTFRQDLEFVKELAGRAAAFRAEFILTVNHAGLDAGGEVLGMLRRGGPPVASWFVDLHDLSVYRPVDPESRLAVFSWRPTAPAQLRAAGVPLAFYLPLAADPEAFTPGKPQDRLRFDAAFAGGTWTAKIGTNLGVGRYPRALLRIWRRLGSALERAPEADVRALLAQESAEALAAFDALDPPVARMFRRLADQAASRVRRLRAVERLLPFSPLVVGDRYWAKALARAGRPFTWMGRMRYERELPDLYRSTRICFNTNSLQSRQAVNQRAFDVPACGGFVLGERSAALDELFDPGAETACYESLDDIGPQTQRWLADQPGRVRIARAARARVLAQHTYEHRLVELVRRMRESF
ncbi:MAG: spore maturation protein CgeB [Desulfovibrionales bacterium]|nr:spore maturation protein CgeB [Desulfovibrionales bacterium]